LKKFYILFLFLTSLCANAQDDIFIPKFRNITDINGLAQNTINTIFQDSKGFVWIGTQNGLSRFDSWEFIHFRQDFNKPVSDNSFRGNNVFDITEDREGNIWVATDKGINTLSAKNEQWTFQDIGNNGIPKKLILKDSSIFIGTSTKFLHYIIKEENEFNRFDFFSKKTNDILSYSKDKLLIILDGELFVYDISNKSYKSPKGTTKGLTCIFRDSVGKVYIGSTNGDLYLFQNEQLSLFAKLPSTQPIITIIEDDNNRLWLGTSNESGLWIINKKYPTNIVNIKNDPSDNRSLAGNNVLSSIKDRDKAIWIGTDGGGISRYDVFNEQFFNHTAFKNVKGKLRNAFIWAIEPDANGNLWIGSNNGDISLYDSQNRDFSLVSSQIGSSIQSLKLDSRGWLWIGSESNGLFVDKNPDLSGLKLTSVLSATLNEEKIKHIIEDSGDRTIWVATVNNGVVHINPSDLKSKAPMDKFDNTEIESRMRLNYVYRLHQDKMNPDIIYAGSYGSGLFKLDTSVPDSKFQSVGDTIDIRGENDQLRVLGIMEDPKDSDLIWVCTSEAGIKVYNKKKNKYIRTFAKEDGLASNTVYGMVSDKTGNIWMSTRKGITKFVYEDKKFENYGINQGLDWLEFNAGAFAQLDKGDIYFGSFKKTKHQKFI